ncbi:MAG: 2Fe-2S iron-sulfur cluster-binding protein [Acidiferrobacterales bacterium]|nr:2Fe-2S iron-sulfur cluster-binding protein [Acidiferrobacterales bacterium]
MSNRFNRLPDGGLIDRNQTIEFVFNGRKHTGFQGDTLAAALLANGIDVVSRSFKYHRPRGFRALGHADVSSMVQIHGDEDAPNMLASTVPLSEGLTATSVNCWPSVKFDMGAALSLLSPIIPAGFYYKTFMWPHWHLFEPFIRKAAGFGHAPKSIPSRPHASGYDHCDILVVGAGPAGLCAGLAASRSGARVILADEMLQPGGSLLGSCAAIDGKCVTAWLSEVVAELDANPNVTRLQDATVWGYLEGNHAVISERSPEPENILRRSRRVWAKQVIVATGAVERPIVFENNDRPGVMHASAVSSYIRNHAIKMGRKAVLFTNNNCSYRTISDLKHAGISIAAVVDVRSRVDDNVRGIVPQDAAFYPDSVIQKVQGGHRVTAVAIHSRTTGSFNTSLDCDLVCVSGGWNPNVHLFSQSGGRLQYSERIHGFVPAEPLQNTLAAGAVCGHLNLNDSIQDGLLAGKIAATTLGFQDPTLPSYQVDAPFDIDYGIEEYWSVPTDNRRGKAFVDLAGDVTVHDLHLALREGYESIEHLKRYTTTGMGLDQGKTANVNAIGIAAKHLGISIGELGTTTFRPPYTPIEFGEFAGSCREDAVLPYRFTPMTEWHKSAGAVMFEAGARWIRPSYYPHPGESMDQAIQRECRAVREGVAIYDGSPLAKFALQGPGTETLLDLMYTNSFENLPIQQGRYGIMLHEDGRIFDDGVTFRLGDEEYLMSGATGNGALLEARLDSFINVERPDLNVLFTPVTSQWANATVCGPLARTLLERIESNIDFSADAFPFMHMREGVFAGMPVRVFRVSFTGELSFEINTPARYGLDLWIHLMNAGEPYQICPIGSEANHVLRVEKGFISLAHEVDGTIDPYDLGMGWIVSKRKSDFVGMKAMQIRRKGDDSRQHLIGLLPAHCGEPPPEGAPLVSAKDATRSEGFVSAGVWSPVLNRSIALGLLVNGRERLNETVYINAYGKIIPAVVCEPRFYDPDGANMRM